MYCILVKYSHILVLNTMICECVFDRELHKLTKILGENIVIHANGARYVVNKFAKLEQFSV